AQVRDRIRNVALLPQYRSSDLEWRLSLPNISPSLFEIATSLSSPWGLAILARMDSHVIRKLRPHVTQENFGRYEKYLTGIVMLGFPLPTPTSPAVYAFENGFSGAIDAVRTVNEGSAAVTELISLYNKFCDSSQVSSMLQNIAEEEPESQLL